MVVSRERREPARNRAKPRDSARVHGIFAFLVDLAIIPFIGRNAERCEGVRESPG